MLLWGMPMSLLVKNLLWTNPVAGREKVPRGKPVDGK